MSKLPVVSSLDLIKYLSKKGFQYHHTKGSHHVYKLNDRIVVVPERKEMGKGLLKAILEEAGINRDDFILEWNK
ncbi:MAG: type II toxin-antitoxin system HicA family toxin [Candidatus Nitrosopolaris sp.]